jgi:hypothetical protein
MSKPNDRSRPVEALKRPEAAEARRLRAAELLAQGRSQAEVAELVGVSRDAVACGHRLVFGHPHNTG